MEKGTKVMRRAGSPNYGFFEASLSNGKVRVRWHHGYGQYIRTTVKPVSIMPYDEEEAARRLWQIDRKRAVAFFQRNHSDDQHFYEAHQCKENMVIWVPTYPGSSRICTIKVCRECRGSYPEIYHTNRDER